MISFRKGKTKFGDDGPVERCALVLVVIGSFLIPFMGSSLSLALPLIQRDLSVSILILGWIPTAFTLANAALVLPFGRLADIYGRKRVFTIGFVVYTLASLLAVFSTSGIILVLFSFLQGLGCAMIFATGIALLITIFPQEKRGQVLGIYLAAVYLGLFMGPLLGGFLVQNFGWESIFFINLPIGLFAISLILLRFKGEWRGSSGEKFDISGSIIYALSLSALMYGVSTLTDFQGQLSLLTGLVGVIIFYKIVNGSKAPIIPLEIFKNRLTSFSGLALFLLAVATSAMWTLLSLYLQDLRGLDPLTTALILAVQPLTVAILSPLIGRWWNEKDDLSITIIGPVLCAIGLFTFTQLDVNTSYLLVVGGLLLIGVGMGLFSVPTNQNFLGSFTRQYYGVGSATLSTTIFIGQTVSLGFLLLILTGFMGNVEIEPSNYQLLLEGLRVSFMIFAVSAAIGGVVSYVIRVKISK